MANSMYPQHHSQPMLKSVDLGTTIISSSRINPEFNINSITKGVTNDFLKHPLCPRKTKINVPKSTRKLVDKD